MSTKKRLNVNLPAEVAEKLRIQAERDDRSMNQQAARYIKEKVQEKDDDSDDSQKNTQPE